MSENVCAWYDPLCGISGLIERLEQLFISIWNSLLSGLASLFELIPAPSFLANLTTTELPSGVAWAVGIFQIEFGLSVVVSAYTLRFIIRRIPGIG
ncbi:MAG: hypothetical protein RPS47_10840 [Colwellia sp.]|jgi:hypothetical protein